MSRSSALREDQRRQYLKAMGVPCLVPRFILPGAALSRRCEMPRPASAGDAAAPAMASGALRQTLQTTAMQPEAPVPEAERTSGAPTTAVRGSRPPRASESRDRATAPRAAAVRFSLTLCRSGDWLVIDDGPAPSRDYLALLANLVYACGHRVAPQGEEFQWPPPLNRPLQLDLSAAAAGQVLASRLQTLHQRQPLSRLLLLGRRPGQLLSGWPGEDGMQRLELPASLWRALAEPDAKRELWLQLAAAGWL